MCPVLVVAFTINKLLYCFFPLRFHWELSLFITVSSPFFRFRLLGLKIHLFDHGKCFFQRSPICLLKSRTKYVINFLGCLLAFLSSGIYRSRVCAHVRSKVLSNSYWALHWTTFELLWAHREEWLIYRISVESPLTVHQAGNFFQFLALNTSKYCCHSFVLRECKFVSLY
jgi:hypothetical protein